MVETTIVPLICPTDLTKRCCHLVGDAVALQVPKNLLKFGEF
jgi:hypothetical protein